jgi:hypothetical protein
LLALYEALAYIKRWSPGLVELLAMIEMVAR